MQVSLSLIEVVIFQIGAIVLGFSIHLFLSNRHSINALEQSAGLHSDISVADEWRLKYYDQLDQQAKYAEELRDELAEAKARERLVIMELEQLRKELNEIKESEGAKLY